MGAPKVLSFFLILFFASICVSEAAPLDSKWSILVAPRSGKLGKNLKNYCESWRMNVELNNIRYFSLVPGECVYHISKYMTSTQYRVDIEMAVEQSIYYFNSVSIVGDGKDAWIFDLDDTLLSTVPYFKSHNFGGDGVDRNSLEKWMKKGKAPAVKGVLSLYNLLKVKGVKIFIITERSISLRSATAENLVSRDITGWTDLLMREDEDNGKTVKTLKLEKREKLINAGNRILGSMGDQWNDVLGPSAGVRSFKLPNCMYYST